MTTQVNTIICIGGYCEEEGENSRVRSHSHGNYTTIVMEKAWKMGQKTVLEKIF